MLRIRWLPIAGGKQGTWNNLNICVFQRAVSSRCDQCGNYHFRAGRHSSCTCYGIEITYAHSLVFLSSGNMGKNKQKGKKQKNVFQVANKHLKPKNKAKPVTTTLKHVRSLFSGVFSFFLGYILYSLLVSSACSVHFSIICAFTDQCGEKREGGEPQSDFHRSPEGC